jgi:hypothetical protein
MTDLPDLRIKALVSFPAQVVGGAGLSVTKTNGAYRFDLDYSEFAQYPAVPPASQPTTSVLLWESSSSQYGRISVAGLQTSILGNLTGPVVITPPAGTTSQGISITQVGPGSGSSASDLSYNSIRVDEGYATPGFGTFGLYTTLNTGGSNAAGQKYAIRGLTNLAYPGATTVGDVVGVSGWAISPVPNGGTNTGTGAAGSLYGMEAVAHAFSGATNYFVICGGESDAIIDPGASAKHRWGWSLVGNGSLQGVATDAALEIGSVGAGAYKFGILLDSIHGAPPLSTNGTVLGTDGTAATVANGIDLSAFTITGNFIKGPNGARIDGSGNVFGTNITLTPPSSVTPVSNGQLTFEATSNTQLKIKYKGSDGVVRSVTLTLA